MARPEWLCVSCGEVLGVVQGGELYPEKGLATRTSGPNLVVVCSHCGFTKTWYTSDPVVRAVYQLVSAVSDVAAKSMINQIGKEMHSKQD